VAASTDAHALCSLSNQCQLKLLPQWFRYARWLQPNRPEWERLSISACVREGRFFERLVVMLKFGPEPWFEPELLELDLKFSPKFREIIEPNLKSGSWFKALQKGSNLNRTSVTQWQKIRRSDSLSTLSDKVISLYNSYFGTGGQWGLWSPLYNIEGTSQTVLSTPYPP
jgi:hypothetical protein